MNTNLAAPLIGALPDSRQVRQQAKFAKGYCRMGSCADAGRCDHFVLSADVQRSEESWRSEEVDCPASPFKDVEALLDWLGL